MSACLDWASDTLKTLIIIVSCIQKSNNLFRMSPNSENKRFQQRMLSRNTIKEVLISELNYYYNKNEEYFGKSTLRSGSWYTNLPKVEGNMITNVSNLGLVFTELN